MQGAVTARKKPLSPGPTTDSNYASVGPDPAESSISSTSPAGVDLGFGRGEWAKGGALVVLGTGANESGMRS